MGKIDDFEDKIGKGVKKLDLWGELFVKLLPYVFGVACGVYCIYLLFKMFVF